MSGPVSSQQGQRLDPVALILFSVCVLLGSANFIAVRFSNVELPPFWGAGLRFLLAAAIFAVLALLLRPRVPPRAEIRLIGLYGVLNFGLAFGFSYWALLHVTASVATVIWATVPLATLLLAVIQRLERFRTRALLGGAVALAGILWLVLAPGVERVPLAAAVAMLLGTLCVAQSIILGKRISHNHPVMTNAIAMGTGAGLLLAASLAVGESWSWPRQPDVLLALLYLVFTSAVLFVLVIFLIRRWSPTAASYVIVMFPVVTPLLEAWLAQVPLRLELLVGVMVVLAGVWIGALAPSASTVPRGER